MLTAARKAMQEIEKAEDRTEAGAYLEALEAYDSAFQAVRALGEVGSWARNYHTPLAQDACRTWASSLIHKQDVSESQNRKRKALRPESWAPHLES
mmetsp:Transcript_42063/g.65777  ORF Transcript_42063/g.65777 Transcript_42063/m.65777 type:complete len:96 (+) Transcript_42063:227-514(+)